MPRQDATRYEYDAALSFAGADRKAAEHLAKNLKSRGLKVFYDKDHLASLWGKRQSDFEDIYGPKSRFVIPFVSKHYARKDWTRLEFDSAKREARRRSGEFILPIRVDDTLLLGLSSDQVYLRLGEHSIHEIAETFARKCGKTGAPRKRLQARSQHTQHLSLLSQKTRHALGLVATSFGLSELEHFQTLFPDVNWRAELPRLAKLGLLEGPKVSVRASRSVRKFFEKEPDWAKFNERWISVLTPIKEYFDIAPFLAFHYFLAGRDEDCVNVLAEIAEEPSVGSWNDVYLAILEPLASSRRATRMTDEARFCLYNATGIFLSRQGRTGDAMGWFVKLRAASWRSRKLQWAGRSCLNIGIVYLNGGEPDKAILQYRKAIEYGKRTRDDQLIARAQGNLAPLIAERSPDEAIQLMKDSISRKSKIRDATGVAVAYAQMGQVQARRGRPDEALKYFVRAKRLAEKSGDAHSLALTLQNIGSVHLNAGRAKQALQYYQLAGRLAAKHGYVDTQILAGICEGRALHELRQFQKAARTFRTILALSNNTGDREAEVSSLHALGVLQLLSGRPSRGRALLQRALKAARALGDPQWIVRCRTDGCRRVVKRAFLDFDRARLKHAARNEQRLRHWDVAGVLWETWADAGVASVTAPSAIDRGYRSALACFEKNPDSVGEIIRVLGKLHLWLWQVHRYSSGLDALDKMEIAARKAHRREDEIRAVDQRGVCLQELGRCQEAERLHRRAARLARNLPRKEHLARSLTNLGEALRKLAKYDAAIQVFREAEGVASKAGDIDGFLSATGNRALALWEMGRVDQSTRLSRKCRETARQQQRWGDYVFFTARLAQLAWDCGRPKEAKKAFERAMGDARRHHAREALPRIVLNYARLLLSIGEPAAALRALRQYENALPSDPDVYLFHYTLGELYTQANDLTSAEKHFRSGRLCAEAAHDSDYIAMCAAALADIFEFRANYRAAEVELRFAVSFEPEAEGRVLLLAQLLGVLTKAGSARQVESTFNEVRELAQGLGLSHVLADIHYIIGAWEWERTSGKSLEAMKALLVALLHSTEVDGNSYADLLILVVRLLVRQRHRPQNMTSVIAQLQEWISGELSGSNRVIRHLMLPFTLAAHLLPFAEQPRKFNAEFRRQLNIAVNPSLR